MGVTDGGPIDGAAGDYCALPEARENSARRDRDSGGSANVANVVVYTKTGCPYCAAAKDDLKQRGQAYTEHNVTDHPDKLPELLKWSGGQRRVPIIVTDGTASIGFGGS